MRVRGLANIDFTYSRNGNTSYMVGMTYFMLRGYVCSLSL